MGLITWAGTTLNVVNRSAHTGTPVRSLLDRALSEIASAALILGILT